MLDSERNSHETDGSDESAPQHRGAAAPAVFNGPAEPAAAAVPAALFQPPQVLFQPPAPPAPQAQPQAPAAADRGTADRGTADRGTADREADAGQPGGSADGKPDADAADASRGSRKSRSRSRSARGRAAADEAVLSADSAGAVAEAEASDGDTAAAAASGADEEEQSGTRRRRRRNTRARGRAEAASDDDADSREGSEESGDDAVEAAADGGDSDGDGADDTGASGRRRRRKRRRGSAESDVTSPDDPPDTVVHVREAHNPADDVRAIKGSTRLEAKKQRRREGRESGRRRPPVVTESEFLARRESVERTMVVRQRGDRTQIAVLEDGVLVEHYVNRATHASYVGNVYLGKVQNVLPSMEAAFVDIGKGRNAVLYAGEVNFDASGLEGQPKRIESALKPGQSVIVQVTKDPVGHKGARLTSQVSLPGRYLVYVPGASMTGISRKLPDTERTRLKQILKKVTPENAGVIVRTAAEGAAEAELDRDITRLAAQWESIQKKAKSASAPALLYGEPDLTIRVVRDVFNEDFSKLIVSGDEGWEVIDEYVRYVAPHLADRISRWDGSDEERAADDVFAAYRIDEQLAKALDRKVWLPSGGSLVIDRTEAMTVIDVNTGKFTGQGGNLEETVTRNNLEAAEEIVRQLRLRDVGGIVVIDFIDMVLESNRELVLRRLLECLARDRTKHQVAEVTSLGLVQMTRKRVGAGLLEAFSQQCECCNGRGVIVTLDPAEPAHRASAGTAHRAVPAPPGPASGNGNGNGRGNGSGKSGGGRRGNGRRDDDRRDDERADAGPNTGAGQSTAEVTAQSTAGTEERTEAKQNGAATAQAGTAARGTSANGGRRTRRSTSAGTAFATAVVVEDTDPVPVVTPAPAAAEPVQVTEDSAAAAPAARTVRRTRAGSAVARVTVVTEPATEADPQSAAEEEPQATSAPAAAEEPVVTEAQAAVAEPSAAEPAVTESPAVAEPAVVEPAVAEPPVAEPPVAEPVVAESPAVPEPAETEPVAAEPAVVEPVVAEPAVVEPVVAESAVAEPAVAEPVVAESPVDEAPADEATVTETEPAPAVSLDPGAADAEPQLAAEGQSAAEPATEDSAAERTAAAPAAELSEAPAEEPATEEPAE